MATMSINDNDNFYLDLRGGFPSDRSRIAIETDTGLRYSWSDLERASAMIANYLDSLGLAPGSRIAVQVEKSVESLALYLATLRSGNVFVPLNTAYKSSEVEYFLQDATPAVVVCSAKNLSWISALSIKAGVRVVLTLNDDRTGTLLDKARDFPDQQMPAHVRAHELAALLYTSGTTGRSKGAMISHGNLQSNATTLKDYWGFSAKDTLIHALPIFHIHGLFVATHIALLSGAKILWHAKFDAAACINAMPKATAFMGVPTYYVRMLSELALNRTATGSMRIFTSGSAPMLPETFQAWKQATGHDIVERYGMTETGMLTSNPYAADGRFGGAAERRAGTVGFPLPGVDLFIADKNGKNLATGEIGVISVKGDGVFNGYWNLPEKTAEEFDARAYFKTGDLGSIDERGYVTISGRGKDLIISGGFNVYPAELEEKINELPGVDESAVVGVPHPDFGEVPVAIVVAKKGAHLFGPEIIATLKADLANFKVPKACFVVSELPRNAMGKVQKNILRDEQKALFLDPTASLATMPSKGD